jgi:hypothetical protein
VCDHCSNIGLGTNLIEPWGARAAIPTNAETRKRYFNSPLPDLSEINRAMREAFEGRPMHVVG